MLLAKLTCEPSMSDSRQPRVIFALLGPVGEVATGGQRVRVLGARDPLGRRQQRHDRLSADAMS